MKRVFRLEGLDCADCAAKLEKKLGDIEHATGANINFVTLKCTLEAAEDKIDAVVARAMDIIRIEEPDVEVSRA